MAEDFSAYGRDEKPVQSLVRELEGKKLLRRHA
jgi:hypothetical protein